MKKVLILWPCNGGPLTAYKYVEKCSIYLYFKHHFMSPIFALSILNTNQAAFTMKFFTPQVQISRTVRVGQPNEYELHTITFCPETNFVADGYTIDDSRLHEGVLKVEIKIKQSNTLSALEYITPVVHTFSLEAYPFPTGEGWVIATVKATLLVAVDGNPVKEGGTKTISTADADNHSKPSGYYGLT